MQKKNEKEIKYKAWFDYSCHYCCRFNDVCIRFQWR